MTRCCETCGKKLERKRHANGKWEPNRTFEVRRFCDRVCRADTWKKQELRVLTILYPYFASPLIAKGLGRTHSAVRQKGKELALMRTARGRSNAAKYAQRIVRTDRKLLPRAIL